MKSSRQIEKQMQRWEVKEFEARKATMKAESALEKAENKERAIALRIDELYDELWDAKDREEGAA